jgi:protein TonB
VPDLRVKQLPTPQSRQRIHALRGPWAGSAIAHLVVLALILLVRVVAPPPPPEQPTFAIEFEPDTTQTPGGPNPSKATETPKGEKTQPVAPSQGQPPPPSAPQMNLIPPEYTQPPPPPDEEAEPMPEPMRRPHYARTGPTRSNDHNPFSNPMNFSLAPRASQHASGGMPNARGLDLSAGPVVRGGRLMDSVAHVVGPGGTADYLALLSEFIETHKYYPEGAARNNEEGSATVRITIQRDGTVRALSLESSSGSSLLDSAWMAVFRDNRLPPFTDDMPGAQQTFTLTLNYQLIYR